MSFSGDSIGELLSVRFLDDDWWSCTDCGICSVSALDEWHVLPVLREGSFCCTAACNDSLGDVSSILVMPSVIELWLHIGANDDSGCTSCTVVPCQLLF